MRRKLVLLNLVLLALAAVAGWRLRIEWVEAHRHESAVIHAKLPPAAAPPFKALEPPPPVTPVQYQDIAQKDLFAKDRNPNVVVETVAAPPPPPMPPLPVIRGIFNFGGVSAIMAENTKTQPKEVHPGDKVGEFTLVALNNQEIVLEWNGEQVHKNVSELMDHSIPEQAAAPAAAAAAAPPPTPQINAKSGPGVDMGAGRKACVPGDATPAGTMQDGLKKVTWETPFGTGCAWEVPK